jgi:hypothetical protein
MPWTASDAERVVNLARRMAIPVDDAIRQLMWAEQPDRPLPPGTEVEVLNRYQEHWVAGFEIATVQHDRYRLRRHSDNTVLPAAFTMNEVRPRL